MDHPNTKQLLALYKNELSKDEVFSITEHLNHCTTCQRDYENVSRLLNGLQKTDLATPEPSTTQKLVAAFRQKQLRLANRLRQSASLEFDSWANQPAGLRGQVSQRQILLSEGIYDIDLQIDTPPSTPYFDIQGQILTVDEMEGGTISTIDLEGLQVRLHDANGEAWWGVTDKNGRFSFLQLNYGTYDFQLLLDDHDIIFKELDIIA